jgi:DNA-binding response OmpR family regulator
MELKKRKIVFVDDDRNVLSALRRELQGLRTEWDMDFFESGDSALNAMRETQADIVVTDIRMPGMSGYDFLRLVKNEFESTVPMVLSGQMDEGVARALVPSHEFVMHKPCSRDELVRRIRSAILQRENLFAVRRKLSEECVVEGLELLLRRGLASGLVTFSDLPDYIRASLPLDVGTDTFGIQDDKLDLSLLDELRDL